MEDLAGGRTGMTRLELERIARNASPPVGATDVCLVVTGTPGERLTSGAPAGRGGTTRHGVAWVIDGRVKSEPIATFERTADAAALADLLAGTPRSGPDRLAPREVDRTRPAAPVGVEALAHPAAIPDGSRAGEQIGLGLGS